MAKARIMTSNILNAFSYGTSTFVNGVSYGTSTFVNGLSYGASYFSYPTKKIPNRMHLEEMNKNPTPNLNLNIDERLDDFILRTLSTKPFACDDIFYSDCILSFYAANKNDLVHAAKKTLKDLFILSHFDPEKLKNLIKIIKLEAPTWLNDHKSQIDNFNIVQKIFNEEIRSIGLAALGIKIEEFTKNKEKLTQEDICKINSFLTNAKGFIEIIEKIPAAANDLILQDKINKEILTLKLQEKIFLYREKIIFSDTFAEDLIYKKSRLDEILSCINLYNKTYAKNQAEKINVSDYIEQSKALTQLIEFYNKVSESNASLKKIKNYYIDKLASETEIVQLQEKFNQECRKFNECMGDLNKRLTNLQSLINNLSFLDRDVSLGNVAINDIQAYSCKLLEKSRTSFAESNEAFLKQLRKQSDPNHFHPSRIDGELFVKIREAFIRDPAFVNLKKYCQKKNNADPKKSALGELITRIEKAKNLNQLLITASKGYTKSIVAPLNPFDPYHADYLQSINFYNKANNPFDDNKKIPLAEQCLERKYISYCDSAFPGLVKYNPGSNNCLGINFFRLANGFESSTDELLHHLEKSLIQIVERNGVSLSCLANQVNDAKRLNKSK